MLQLSLGVYHIHFFMTKQYHISSPAVLLLCVAQCAKIQNIYLTSSQLHDIDCQPHDNNRSSHSLYFLVHIDITNVQTYNSILPLSRMQQCYVLLIQNSHLSPYSHYSTSYFPNLEYTYICVYMPMLICTLCYFNPAMINQ